MRTECYAEPLKLKRRVAKRKEVAKPLLSKERKIYIDLDEGKVVEKPVRLSHLDRRFSVQQ